MIFRLAQFWLIERELSPFYVGFKLNEIPFSSSNYGNPREEFKALDTKRSAFHAGNA